MRWFIDCGVFLLGVVSVVWIFEANVASNSRLQMDEALSNTESGRTERSAIVVYQASFKNSSDSSKLCSIYGL